MTKPVYYQVEQRMCGAWSPTKDGGIILVSGSFRDLLDTVDITEYQPIIKLDPYKLPGDWIPKHVYSKMLRRVLDHQREWGKLSWWRRALYRVFPFFNLDVTFITLKDNQRYACRNAAAEGAAYLRLFNRLDDVGSYRTIPDYLLNWVVAARGGCADAACRVLVCRSEQGHAGEALDVYWSDRD